MEIPEKPAAGTTEAKLLLAPDGRVRPFWRAFLFLVFGFFLILLVARLFGGLQVLGYAALNTLLLLESWLLLAALDRRSFRTLGLWFYPRWAKELLAGVGVGAGLLAAVVGLQAVAGGLAYGGLRPEVAGTWLPTARAGLLLFLAAAFEEIVFRGYGFQRLVDSFSRVGAIAAFAGLFGLVHLGNPSATAISTANTVLAGVLLAVAYLKTRALWMPLGLHWAWNFVMGPVLSLPVSGIRVGPRVFRVEASGPEWLSGGAYGPEGSAVLTVVCVGAIAWLARTKQVAVSAAMAEWLKPDAPAEPKSGIIG